jgi:ferredoxin/predicted Fe-Mo cluster-binding NifX family protein
VVHCRQGLKLIWKADICIQEKDRMISISINKCVGCEICVKVCPDGIEVADGIAILKDKNVDCFEKAAKACPQNAIKEIEKDLLFAIGTDDDKLIKPDDHVGMSRYFQVWQYLNGEMKFKEKRENVKYKEDEDRIHGDPGKAKATSSVLTGINVLVGKMFGPNIVRLRNKFVCVVIREPEIEKAIEIIKESINEIIDEYNKKNRNGIILK